MKKIYKAGLLTTLVMVAVLFFILDPDEQPIFPRCIFYSFSGYYCPGCGSQRAIHNLMHLNFAGVVQNNILFLPAMLAVTYHYLHPVLNRNFSWRLPNILYMKNTPWIIFGIIVFFWIIRNLPWYPFSALAPN
jgi:hypothetical protein